MPITLKDFLALFDYSIPAGNGFNVECPAHVDSVASLSVTDGLKGLLLRCHAGCTTDAICKNLGIQVADLFKQNGSNGNGSGSGWKVICSYSYQHIDGSLAFEVQRCDTPKGKQFPIRWKGPDGKWINGTTAGEYYLHPYYNEWRRTKPGKTPASYQRHDWPALDLILYKLPELTTASPSEIVFIVEGEKDADRLASYGLTVTTNAGGANRRWKKEYSKILDGRKIAIIPDNDGPGETHANEILDSVIRHAKQSKAVILKLPGLALKGDVSDWLDAGNDISELIALADAALAPPIATLAQPPPPTQPAASTQAAVGKVYNTTDMGNAERFVDRFNGVVRYCSKLGKDGAWLIWDGRRWQVDEKLKIHRMAKEIVPDIYADAQAAHYKADKERFFDWAIKTEGLATRNNMVKDARPAIAVGVDELDTHPWLLNVKNGTIDLRDGKLRPHSQADYLTKTLQIEYDEKAECPVWINFVNSSQWDKEEMIEYLQKAVGYSLTGDVREKCMFILHGPKDTGKSTFVETMQMLLGEYAIKIQTQTLMWRRERQQSNDIAILKGARFVHASEAEEHERLAEAQIKELTGGDTVTCRFLHAEFFQFQPEFKLWLSTNHKPKVSSDKATWGRLKLIPFTYQAHEDEKDTGLKAKLKAELPGILRWAVEGCLKWQKDGLAMPQIVQGATGKYQDEMDTIGQFLDECCEMDDSFDVMSRELYATYRQWCIDTGERVESQRALGLKLNDRGLKNVRITSGAHKGRTEWQGIKIKP